MDQRNDPERDTLKPANVAQLFIVHNRDTYTLRIGGVCKSYEEAIAILEQAKRQLEKSLRRMPTPDFEDTISFDVPLKNIKPRF